MVLEQLSQRRVVERDVEIAVGVPRDVVARRRQRRAQRVNQGAEVVNDHLLGDVRAVEE